MYPSCTRFRSDDDIDLFVEIQVAMVTCRKDVWHVRDLWSDLIQLKGEESTVFILECFLAVEKLWERRILDKKRKL